jgi:outer membrane receptor protein involved in Fe transport
MGLPDFYLQFGSAPSNIRSHAVYGFAQDEWHVTKNLTLTLGTRYEYSSPKLDTKQRPFSLHLGQQSVVFPGAPTGLLFPGDPGAPKGANLPDRNDWAPRFGFAWSPGSSGKTSLRGGIGVFYDILKGEDNLQFNGQAPFFGFAFLGWDPIGNPSQEVNYLSSPS